MGHQRENDAKLITARVNGEQGIRRRLLIAPTGEGSNGPRARLFRLGGIPSSLYTSFSFRVSMSLAVGYIDVCPNRIVDLDLGESSSYLLQVCEEQYDLP